MIWSSFPHSNPWHFVPCRFFYSDVQYPPHHDGIVWIEGGSVVTHNFRVFQAPACRYWSTNRPACVKILENCIFSLPLPGRLVVASDYLENQTTETHTWLFDSSHKTQPQDRSHDQPHSIQLLHHLVVPIGDLLCCIVHLRVSLLLQILIGIALLTWYWIHQY